jgi:O-acetylserine/cysteine efflux transporter
LAFIGFSVILFFREESVTTTGVVLVLLSAIFWTICNVIIKKHKPDDIVSFITWSSLFVPVPVLLFSFGQELYATGAINFSNVMSMPNAEAWISILFQAYITTLLGYGVWAWAITRYGLSDVAPFSLLIPVSGLFFGWLIYDEMLSMASVFCSFLILLGLAFLFLSSLCSYNQEC